MAQTPGGLPYPVGTDKVVDGDNAIKALAEAIEARYGGAGTPTLERPAIPAMGPLNNTDTPGFSFVDWTPPRSGLARVTAALDVTLNGTPGYVAAAVRIGGVVQDAVYLFPDPYPPGTVRSWLEPRSSPFRVAQGVKVAIEVSLWVYNTSGTWTVNAGFSHYRIEVE